MDGSDVINVKSCRTCGMLGNASDFGTKGINKKSGRVYLTADCRECHNKKQNQYSRDHYIGSHKSVAGKKAAQERKLKRQEIAEARRAAPTKFCSRCKQTKPRSAYHNRVRSVDGLVLWCIECMASYATKYVTDPELKAKRKAQSQLWRSKRTPEQRKIECERVKSRARTDWGRQMWAQARDRARERGLAFDLTPDWVRERANVCQLSGMILMPRSGRGGRMGPLSPSIDKIDSTAGYTQDNCRVVCFALNTAFMHWGSKAFEPIAKAWLERLANAK